MSIAGRGFLAAAKAMRDDRGDLEESVGAWRKVGVWACG
jgi:hypothetical protein